MSDARNGAPQKQNGRSESPDRSLDKSKDQKLILAREMTDTAFVPPRPATFIW